MGISFRANSKVLPILHSLFTSSSLESASYRSTKLLVLFLLNYVEVPIEDFLSLTKLSGRSPVFPWMLTGCSRPVQAMASEFSLLPDIFLKQVVDMCLNQI
jgi:hypothetical protein